MKRLNVLLRMQFRDMLFGHLIFLAVNIGIVLVLVLVNYMFFSTNSNYTGFCLTAGIYIFVLSVTTIRTSMRLGAQMGTSRQTVCLAFALYALCCAVLMAVMGEVFLTAADFVCTHVGTMVISDLYPMFFLHEMDFIDLTLAQHLQTIFFNASVNLLCAALGAALSMLFWRLNRVGQVLVAVLLCTLPIWIPFLLIRTVAYKINLLPFYRLLSQPSFLIFLFLAVAAVCLLLNGLLGRKVSIRPAK